MVGHKGRPAAAALAAVIALAGCSAGQVAETAVIQPAIAGVDTQSPDGTLLIRNLAVLYDTTAGYPAGSTAPLQVSLFNQTERPMTVLISSGAPAGAVRARQIGLVGAPETSAAPEPAGSRPAADPIPSADEVVAESGPPTTAPVPGASLVPDTTATPAQPARITLPGLSSATFPGDTGPKLLAIGLSEQLRPGMALSLVFEVDTESQPTTVRAPMEVPLSPASRTPGIPPDKNLGED